MISFYKMEQTKNKKKLVAVVVDLDTHYQMKLEAVQRKMSVTRLVRELWQNREKKTGVI